MTPALLGQTLAVRSRGSAAGMATVLAVIGILTSPYNALRLKGSISLCAGVFMLLLLVIALSSIFKRRPLFLPRSLSAALLMTLAGYLAAVFIEPELFLRNRLVVLSQILFAVYVIPLTLFNSTNPDVHSVERLIWLWLVANVIGALIVFFQTQHIALPIIENFWITRSRRAAGLNLHPNTMGFYCSLVIPVCLALLLRARRRRAVLGYGLSLVLLLYAINQSGSRTALVASLAGTVVTCAVLLALGSKRINLRIVLICALLATAALAVLPSTGQTAFNRLLGNTWTSSVADQVRAEDNERLWAHFTARPVLGNGYNLYRIHNSYIGLLGIAGIFGALAFALRESYFARSIIHLCRRAPRAPPISFLIAGLAGSYVIWLLSLTKNFVLGSESPQILLALIALLYHASQQPEVHSGSRR